MDIGGLCGVSRMELRRMRRERFKRRLILSGISTAVILSLGFLLLGDFNFFTSRSPEKTVSKFIEDMQAGNYQEAYNFLYCNGPLLTENAFIFAQKNLGDIKQITFKTLENKKFQVKEVRGGKISEYTITAINKGSRVSPKWYIDTTPFTEEISIFTKTKGVKLNIDNNKKELGVSSGQKPLTYRAFIGHTHTVTLQLEGAQTLILDMPTNSLAQIGYMAATDELKNSLSEFVKQYENELSQSYLDWDIERLKPYLKPEGEGHQWVNNTLNSLKTTWTQKNKWLINFKPENAYLEDVNHAVIEIEGIWSDLYKPLKLKYKMEKINNTWKIVTAEIST